MGFNSGFKGFKRIHFFVVREVYCFYNKISLARKKLYSFILIQDSLSSADVPFRICHTGPLEMYRPYYHVLCYAFFQSKTISLWHVLVKGVLSSYIQINQPTRCINLSDLLFVVQIQLNMFPSSSCPSPGAYKLQ